MRHAGDPASAIPLLEEAAELTEDDPLAATVHLRLASARRATGDLDQAAQTLRSLLAAYGTRRPKERALVHFELAQVDLAKGERARAIAELDAALRIDPAHAEALHTQAKLSLEEGQLERAARTYRALLLVVKRPRADGSSWGEVSRAEILFELAEIARLRGEGERATRAARLRVRGRARERRRPRQAPRRPAHTRPARSARGAGASSSDSLVEATGAAETAAIQDEPRGPLRAPPRQAAGVRSTRASRRSRTSSARPSSTPRCTSSRAAPNQVERLRRRDRPLRRDRARRGSRHRSAHLPGPRVRERPGR